MLWVEVEIEDPIDERDISRLCALPEPVELVPWLSLGCLCRAGQVDPSEEDAASVGVPEEAGGAV